MGRAEAVCVYMILVHSIMSTTSLTPETGTPGNQNNFGGPGSISPYNDEL